MAPFMSTDDHLCRKGKGMRPENTDIRQITHFYCCSSLLSSFPNQVNLLIFRLHVFLSHIIHPMWASCRKQQRLGIVFRILKHRKNHFTTFISLILQTYSTSLHTYYKSHFLRYRKKIYFFQFMHYQHQGKVVLKLKVFSRLEKSYFELKHSLLSSD